MKKNRIHKILGRRTRAKTAQATTTAIASTNANATNAKKLDVIDQNFASPKRKDCKLDENCARSVSSLVVNGRSPKSAPSSSPPPSQAAITNGKRNHKNAGGSKVAKKSPHQITKYFHTNGHSDSNSSTNSDDIDTCNGEANDNGNATDVAAAAATADVQKTPVPAHNGCVLMSPDAKSLLNGGSGIKQTTPHRIVIRTSPSKKQRLYVKDPTEVFSNLNIRDGASKSAGGRKGKQTRRKLNVNDSIENGVNTGKVPTNLVKDELGVIDDNDDDDDDNSAITPSVADKLPVSKSNVATTGKITSKNIDKTFAVPKSVAPPSRRIQSTQLTDFFPIRRSGRKTKQAVEQEISQYIETAIEKQLEDGLIVKIFPEKGRGIVAGRAFQRGEFVVEYVGELIDQMEADRREEAYVENAEFGCYMYYFKHKEQQWW